MSIDIRNEPESSDEYVRAIADVLGRYEADHPRAAITVYRQNSACIRIRVVDPDFAGLDQVERDEKVWEYLDRLSEEIRSDITFLLLLTPDEMEKSLANLEFESPVQSCL